MRTKVSKTMIWIILICIIIIGFVFIFLDETCTFHIQKLIEKPSSSTVPQEQSEKIDVKNCTDTFHMALLGQRWIHA